MALSMFAEIADGYTLEGRVEATPGLHPEIQFRYRPSAGPALQDEYARGGQTPETAAKIMARQASEFQSLQDDGTRTPAVRLTQAQCLKLHSGVWRGVWNHCMGFVGPFVETAEANLKSGGPAEAP